MLNFILKNLKDIKEKGLVIFFKKLNKLYKIIFNFIIYLPLFILFIPFYLFIRIISPFYLFRSQELLSSRVGHLAANIDLYLCEKKAGINQPKIWHVDIFFKGKGKISNKYLFKLWKKKIIILPRILVYPIHQINKIFPNSTKFQVGTNSQHDRDIHSLLDKTKPNIQLTNEEELIGKKLLKKLGLNDNDKFVCLIVRDSAYLPHLNYHDYRDGDISKYVLAINELTKLGYYVFRMGVKVKEPLITNNKMVIDYPTLNIRTDFYDIYLASRCEFCISTSTGFDALVSMFRKPICFITVPIGYIYTGSTNYISISKKHVDKNLNIEISLEEIFKRNCGFSMDKKEYEDNSIELIHNTEKEILDLVIEMNLRLTNDIKYSINDNKIQRDFWNIFCKFSDKHCNQNNLLHGKIKSRIGNKFLTNNKNFIYKKNNEQFNNNSCKKKFKRY